MYTYTYIYIYTIYNYSCVYIYTRIHCCKLFYNGYNVNQRFYHGISWQPCQWWFRRSLFGEMIFIMASVLVRAARCCKMLQDATSKWSFLKPLKLVRSLKSAVQRSAAKFTYLLIACLWFRSILTKFQDSFVIGLFLGWRTSQTLWAIAVRLSCVGSLTSFRICKLCSINLSGKQHEFRSFSILVSGSLLRTLSLLTQWHAIPLESWVSGICESFPSWKGGAFDGSSETFLAFFQFAWQVTATRWIDYCRLPTMSTHMFRSRLYIWPALLVCSFVAQPCRLSNWSRIVEPKDCRSLVAQIDQHQLVNGQHLCHWSPSVRILRRSYDVVYSIRSTVAYVTSSKHQWKPAIGFCDKCLGTWWARAITSVVFRGTTLGTFLGTPFYDIILYYSVYNILHFFFVLYMYISDLHIYTYTHTFSLYVYIYKFIYIYI